MVPFLKLVWLGGWGFIIRDDVGEIVVAGKFERVRDACKKWRAAMAALRQANE
jgi:hypothetical protein